MDSLGVQMRRKVFSGMRRAAVERQAEDWLARQAPSFELHAAITRFGDSRTRSIVTVTVLYDLGAKAAARRFEGRLAA